MNSLPVSIGDVRETHGRTITDADLLTWAGLVHDFTRLHFDAEYMRTTPFGGPIAHGYIALNLSIGMFFPTHADWYCPTGCDASLAWEEVRFLAPVRVGDTISCRRTITAIEERAVTHFVEVLNQDGTVVMSGHESVGSGSPN